METDPHGDGDWYGERAARAIDRHFAENPPASWWALFLLWLALKLPHHVIPRRDGSGPYLLRATIVPRRLYLHYFFCSDDESELHSHPFSARLVILSNGYLEERWNNVKQERVVFARRPGHVVKLASETFHRVLLDRGGSWSLFSRGPRVNAPREWSWFFWNPERNRLWNQAEYKRRKRAGRA